MSRQLQPATLLFLLNDKRILLARKKRGFGKGHWNGVGGKPEPGESVEQAAIRECQEEIGVTPQLIKRAGILDFYFPDQQSDWNMTVTVFICTTWRGQPVETEEMKPQWFDIAKIPYDKMWADDQYWLPEVLAGYYVEGDFYFDLNQRLVKHKIRKSMVLGEGFESRSATPKLHDWQ